MVGFTILSVIVLSFLCYASIRTTPRIRTLRRSYKSVKVVEYDVIQEPDDALDVWRRNFYR